MRVWEIENWQSKKLRRKNWGSQYVFLYEGVWYGRKDNHDFTYHQSIIDAVYQIMSYDDVEEYVEPIVKNCKTCANQCTFWLESGHTVSNFACWTDKKEEPVMEKKACSPSCANLGTKLCETCTLGPNYVNAKNHYSPKLPTKTKDLTWQEAYEAWQGGWEVVYTASPSTIANFHLYDMYQVGQVLQTKFNLTGKRR